MPTTRPAAGVLIAIVATLTTLQADAQEMLVAPYLQSVSTNEAWVLWETGSGDVGFVEWGATATLGERSGSTVQVGADSARLHEALLEGLEPATRYFYRVRTGSLESDVFDFVTPPAPDSEEPLRLIAMSDMQQDSGNPEIYSDIIHQGIIEYVSATLEPDLADAIGMVMIAGDLVDDGFVTEQWRREFFQPGAELMRHVPFYPVLGNHERDTDHYFRYFHLPENESTLYEEHWWATDYSNTRIIGLDSNTGYRGEAQLDWLDSVLDDACTRETIDFVFAQLHHPYLSELWPIGETDFTGEVIRRLEDFSTLCDKPSIHFFGHTHGYARGQSRDHQHLWINVASAGGNIDYWGEYEQNDYPQFSVSQDEWGFVVVEVEAGDDPGFRVLRLSRGDESMPRDNEPRDEIEVRLHNEPPDPPIGLGPAGESVDPQCRTLVASAYADPDGDAHGATHWQLSSSCSTFDAPLHESWRQHENFYDEVDLQAGDDLTDEVVPPLEPSSPYCFRVRYRDRGLQWSEWSTPFSFTTGPENSTMTPNLLTNPGAEDGIEGWIVEEGILESLIADECVGTSPHTGSRYFSAGGLCAETPAEHARAVQHVDVSFFSTEIDAGSAVALFSGFTSSYSGSDQPEIGIVIRDGAGTRLAQSELYGSSLSTWMLVEGELAIPRTARSVEFIIMGTRHSGTDNDSYLDDLSLILWNGEEPDCPSLEPPPPLPDAGPDDAGADTGPRPDADTPRDSDVASAADADRTAGADGDGESDAESVTETPVGDDEGCDCRAVGAPRGGWPRSLRLERLWLI